MFKSKRYDDETLNINWHPEYVDNQAFILSEKDANAKSFKYYEPLLNHIIWCDFLLYIILEYYN